MDNKTNLSELTESARELKKKFIELITVLAISFLMVAVLMWLWNGLAVALFSLPIITYWQAWGIYILSNILFKSTSKREKK
jgi:uncharacterized membrane protein (DUF485 family)